MSFLNASSSFQVLASQAKSAERAYIWCLLTSWTLLEYNDIRISVDDFSTNELALIFEAIIELQRDWVVADMLTVRQKLVDNKKFYPDIKTIDNKLLSELITEPFMYHNLRKYESMVKENALKIRTQRVIDKMMEDTERSAWNILSYGQDLISLATNWMGNWGRGFDMRHAHNLADKIAELDWKELYWFSFGNEFKFLDSATKGIQKGKTYRIGAPSNTGKTQFAYSVINNLLAQWAKVAFFTLENEVETTLWYLMSNHQRISMDSIMRWTESGDFDYIEKINKNLAIFDSTFYLSDIFSKIVEFNPDVVILDYIGLMSIRWFREDDKYTEYAVQVQRFVKQIQVSWIDLSNLPTQLQQSEDIRWNPQFYGSTFLRNNTDVGIHIMPWSQFYDMRDRVLQDDIYDYETKNKLKRLSWVTMFLSKNRLWPHSISWNFIVDFQHWAEFTETSAEQFKSLASSFGLW